MTNCSFFYFLPGVISSVTIGNLFVLHIGVLHIQGVHLSETFLCCICNRSCSCYWVHSYRHSCVCIPITCVIYHNGFFLIIVIYLHWYYDNVPRKLVVTQALRRLSPGIYVAWSNHSWPTELLLPCLLVETSNTTWWSQSQNIINYHVWQLLGHVNCSLTKYIESILLDSLSIGLMKEPMSFEDQVSKLMLQPE